MSRVMFFGISVEPPKSFSGHFHHQTRDRRVRKAAAHVTPAPP
jgi:hypothetical protein